MGIVVLESARTNPDQLVHGIRRVVGEIAKVYVLANGDHCPLEVVLGPQSLVVVNLGVTELGISRMLF